MLWGCCTFFHGVTDPMFKLTNFLVEDLVKRQFISLLQILLHHTANTVNTRWGRGGRSELKRKHHASLPIQSGRWQNKRISNMTVPSPSSFHPSSQPRFGTLPATCPLAVKLQGLRGNTWEAAGGTWRDTCYPGNR